MARRFLLITRNDLGNAYVVAESADEDWLRDQTLLWKGDVAVLAEDEAELDPDYEEAVRRWRARDDREVVSQYALLEAEITALDALLTHASETALEEGLPIDEVGERVADAYRSYAYGGRATLSPDEAARVAAIGHAYFGILGVVLAESRRVSETDREAARSLLRLTALNLRDIARGDMTFPADQPGT